MASTLEHKLYEAEQEIEIEKNIGEGLSQGVQQVCGPFAYAGAAALVAYVAGSIIGDTVPQGINYLTGLAFDHNSISQLGNVSIAIPRGYGLVDAVATVLGRDPSSISSGALAAAPVGAAYAGYVLSRMFGPVLERIGYHAK